MKGNFESAKRVGYAVGLSLTLSESVAVTFEGRWLDENAFYVNGQLRF